MCVRVCVQHEGVPSHLLPALAQSQQQATEAAAREEEKKKALKVTECMGVDETPHTPLVLTLPQPPPAPKAQALFNFQGKNEKYVISIATCS